MGKTFTLGQYPNIGISSSGTPTTNYLPKFTGASTIGNSLMQDNGTNVGIYGAVNAAPQFNLYTNGQTNNNVTLAQGFALTTDNIGYLYNRANAAFIFGTNNTERMRITSTGNVGIGTSSPAVTLHALGKIRSQDSRGGSFAAVEIYGGDSSFNPYISVDQNNPLTFITGATERMRITSSGSVFINTTSANITSNMKLSVKQTLGEGAAEVWTSWAGDVSTAAFWVIKYDNVNTTSQIFQRFAINNGGTACGQINANGASQVAFGSYSDIRLKENIAELEPQLNKILALKPCEFDYKDGSGHQIGFIAQEMQEVYPDVVNDSLDGMLTLSGWNKTEARLVKAIQEQQVIINELSAKVTALENKA